jgi:hypothetical protein
MSDYSQVNDYSAKDALATGNPEKLILGSDIDDELSGISTAIASKYDSSDLASQAQAEAESSNVVLMTPARVANWADYNAGMVGDIQALVDPNADRIIGWDDSAGAAIAYSLSTGLTTSGTNLLIDTAVVPQLAATNTFTGAPQTISANGSTRLIIDDANSSGLPGVNMYGTGVVKGLFGQDVGNVLGLGANTLMLYNVSGGLAFTGNNTTSWSFRLSSTGELTTPNSSAAEVGYKGGPVVSSAGGSIALSDAGKIIMASAGVTIPTDATINFPIGTIIRIINHSVSAFTVAPADGVTTTLRWSGTGGLDGSRTLAAYQGGCTIEKLAANFWIINGNLS